jgi:hypothetical protein
MLAASSATACSHEGPATARQGGVVLRGQVSADAFLALSEDFKNYDFIVYACVDTR